jgi:serine/threonine-protein kinase
MMDQHMNIAPQPPGSRRPGIPPAIEAVVLRALAKRPADRFADMAGFQAALAGRPPPASPLRLPLPFLAATLEASSAGEVPGPARGEARPPGDPPAPRALDSDLVGTLAPPAGGPPPSLEPRSRLGRLAIAAVVVGAGALALLLAARPGARLPAPRAPDTVATPVVAPVAPVPAEPPTPAVPAAPAVAAPAAPAPAPGGATAPAAPASVTITIRSLPSGVGIFDLATGARRGVTPLVLTRPRGAAPLALALRKSGYQAQTVSIPSDADTVLQLQMVRKVAARPAAPSTAGLDSL